MEQVIFSIFFCFFVSIKIGVKRGKFELETAPLSTLHSSHSFNAVYAVQVGNFDTACCTVFGTDAEIRTFRTFCIVDNGNIVNDFDSLEGTYTLTFFTADTAIETIFSCNSPFVMVAARYDNIFGIGNKRDKSIRTGSRAESTAHAVNRIDDSGIGNYRDGILWTGVCTVT